MGEAEASLSLIAGLYAQISGLQAKIRELQDDEVAG